MIHWIAAGTLALGTPTTADARGGPGKIVEGGGSQNTFFFTAGPNGAVVELRGGPELRLEPGTTIRRFPGTTRLQLAPGKLTPTYAVLLRSGRVDVVIEDDGKPHPAVLVRGPKGMSGICRSGHLVAIARNDEVTVANRRGSSLTSLGSFWRPLAPEHARTLNWEDGRAAPKPLMDPPTFRSGQRVWIAAIGKASLGGFSWSSVAGATGYKVTLSDATGAAPIDTRQTDGPSLGGAFSPVPPGVYRVHVRARDRRGLLGRLSDPIEVTVVGVEVPDGAYIDASGSVRLARRQTARFTGVDGLVMTYRGAKRWIDASEAIGLYRNEKTVVYLRHPSESGFVSARLEPRGIEADVRVGPKRIVWPRQPASITIRLTDAAGNPAPSWVRPVPRVFLGIEPIEVAWTHTNDVWRAKVPPQKGPGPWVLRVEVEDQFGIPLGRDFVEIVRAKPKRRRVRWRSAARPRRGGS